MYFYVLFEKLHSYWWVFLPCFADSSIGNYPEILFLGTGSSIPNKIRNVSAILLHTR